METVRIRLVFDKDLAETLKTEGLKRCWILLKPQHRTICDLSSHILLVFNLHNACPHGLLLSMEGFALPPFESTCIFKDKDIIRVKRKSGGSTEIVQVDDGLNSLEVVEIMDTQPMATTDMKHLANEEFERESGGYESEEEEDALLEHKEDALNVERSPKLKKASKKRKAPTDLHSSKRKKNKSATAEKCAVIPEFGNDVYAGKNETLSTAKGDKRSKKSKAIPKDKRFCQPQENGNGSADASHTPSGTKKLPSRSARRKKAKRQWLKAQLKAEREERQQRELLEKVNQQSSEKEDRRVPEESSEKGNHKICEEIHEKGDGKLNVDHQQQDDDSDIEDVVPIEIRPGHIRFEPLRKGADQAEQQDRIPVKTFQWNGITTKRKGQKWGTEKVGPGKRNNYNNFSLECSKMLSVEEDSPESGHMDYNKLPLCASLPKEGDVIAYRIIELSSSWTPELSSYRVGKISRYDPQSNRIVLVPVPEYPIIPERKTDDEACPLFQETSLYGEDGSLQADYSSLLEVRTVNHANLNSASPVPREGEDTIINQVGGTCSRINNANETCVSPQDNGEVHAWAEIQQALNAKKAELSQGDDGSKTEISGRSPWSSKALRGSALGPTISLLRAQNEL